MCNIVECLSMISTSLSAITFFYTSRWGAVGGQFELFLFSWLAGFWGTGIGGHLSGRTKDQQILKA